MIFCGTTDYLHNFLTVDEIGDLVILVCPTSGKIVELALLKQMVGQTMVVVEE